MNAWAINIGHWFRSHEVPVNCTLAAITALGATTAAIMAIGAYKSQIDQMRVSLWRSLSEEWDHKLLEFRVVCIKAFKNNPHLALPVHYSKVMNFFETLGYLVRNRRIPRPLAHHTFSYYFAGYFRATENLITQEHNLKKGIWDDVFWLHNLWGEDDLTDEQFKDFVKDELNLLVS